MAWVPFSPIIRQARFDAKGYSPHAMLSIANGVLKSIQERLLRGQDIYDIMAPPLATKYSKWKQRKYGSGIRDMRASGRTFRAMKTLEAGQNRAVIGFTDAVVVGERVRPNNRLSRQWGMSPRNLEAMVELVRNTAENPVVAVQKK